MRIATIIGGALMVLTAGAQGAGPSATPYHSYQGSKERIALTVYLRRMKARNAPYTSFMGRQTRRALKAK